MKESAFRHPAQWTVLYSRAVPDARTRLLDAVAPLHESLPLAALLRGIHPGLLASQARVSRTSYYAHWSAPEAFWLDLVEHVCAHTLDPVQARDRRPAGDLDLSTARTLTRQAFQQRAGSANRRLLMLLWSKSNDRAVGEALRRGYADVTESLAEPVAAMFEAWRREARPPFTNADIVTLVIAIADGLFVRAGFDPHAAPVSLFEDALLAVVAALTRPSAGAPSVAADRAVADVREQARVAPYHWEPVRRGSTRELVLDAFERLLLDRGYSRVTIADVADRAGVSARTVYEHFGSKLNLAVHLSITAALALLEELQTLPDDAAPEALLTAIFGFVSVRRHVFRAAHAANLEDPDTLPYQPERNPIVQMLVERIAPDATRGAEPIVIANLWWRAIVLAAADPQLPGDAASVAHVLVHGVTVTAPVSDAGAVSPPAAAAAAPV